MSLDLAWWCYVSPLDVVVGFAIGVLILWASQLAVAMDEALMTSAAAPVVAILTAALFTWLYPRPEKVRSRRVRVKLLMRSCPFVSVRGCKYALMHERGSTCARALVL